MHRSLVRFAILFTFAATGFAALAHATVPWPAGRILKGPTAASTGQSRISLTVSGDTTLSVMGCSVPTQQWGANAFSEGGSIGGGAYGAETYQGWTTTGPGTSLMLGCVSSAQLILRGFNWAGTALPTTTITGPGNSFSASYNFWGAPADGGGAWFIWQGGSARPGVRLLRATASGTVEPGWPQFGRRFAASGASALRSPGLAADGAGGAVVVLAQDVARAYRLNSDTTLAAGWPVGGVALEAPYLDYTVYATVKLTRADASHFIASWVGSSPEGYYVKCQRFALDGALDPNWPADGVVVRDPRQSGTGLPDLQAVADDAGGVTLAWVDSSWVRVRHVRADGSFGAAYVDGPARVVDLTSWTSSGVGFGLAAGRPGGAAIVFVSPQGDLRGRWWDGDGAPDPDPAHYDARFFTYAELVAANAGYYYGHTRAIGALGDGEGGVYFGWTGTDSWGYQPWAFVSHAPWPGAALLAAPPPAPPALALAAGPNPARGALTARFTLPDSRAARLELLDLAGRRVAARDVAGAGDHAESFAEATALPPGVYLLRLAHGGAVRTARVALLR